MTWRLGIKLESSARVENTLGCWGISPDYLFLLSCLYYLTSASPAFDRHLVDLPRDTWQIHLDEWVYASFHWEWNFENHCNQALFDLWNGLSLRIRVWSDFQFQIVQWALEHDICIYFTETLAPPLPLCHPVTIEVLILLKLCHFFSVLRVRN